MQFRRVIQFFKALQNFPILVTIGLYIETQLEDTNFFHCKLFFWFLSSFTLEQLSKRKTWLTHGQDVIDKIALNNNWKTIHLSHDVSTRSHCTKSHLSQVQEYHQQKFKSIEKISPLHHFSELKRMVFLIFHNVNF